MKKVMTQEDKNKLLLQDLCARLPYDVICEVYDPLQDYEEDYFNAHLIHIDAWTSRCYFWGCSETDPYKIWQVKPYLRPMSSMTGEEMEKYHSYCECDDKDFTGEILYFDTIDSFDYLNSIHVDYRGLIPLDLAIEVTQENNPYGKLK